jgi:hypothetical protein
MKNRTNASANCARLLRFQKQIAHRWYRRAQDFDDPFVRFFFYFSGFNALYFAWAKADALKNDEGRMVREDLQIENLLGKFNSGEARELLRQLNPAIEFFSSRRPVQRMDKRTCHRFDKGEAREGRGAHERLASSSPVDQLAALGKILYLVRCNLVHGSKAEMGDDERIIEASIGPLELLLEIAIDFTEKQLSFNTGY